MNESSSIPEQVDVVVIGAGLGGLTCAVELARQGLEVCVLEQHRVAGGYAHNFKRRGYTFDVSLHHIGGLDPGAMTHGLLTSLGVLDKLELHRRSTLFRSELPGLAVDVPNNAEALAEVLGEVAPGERGKLAELLRFIPELKNDVFGPTMNPEFDVPLAERISSNYLDTTFGQLLSSSLSDPALLAVLGQLWQYIGLPPSRSTANFTTCVFCSTFLEGSYHIRGGGRALSGALVERLRELGGQCLTRSRVRRILVEDGQAVGVERDDGAQVRARRIIAATSPHVTFFDLLSKDEVSKVFRFRLDQMEPSLSVYSLYLGLDCHPAALGIEHENFFFNHQLDHDEAYRRALAHEIDHTDWCLTSYADSDPDLAPGDGAVIAIAELTPAGPWLEMSPDRYRQAKREVRDRLMAKVARRFPALEQHVAVEEFATPRTMVRYTSNHQGAIYGFAQTVSQSNSRRLRNRAPLRGLFLAGAWTWAGGGYEGAMMTGVQTASAVLEDMAVAATAPPIRIHPPQLPAARPAPGQDQRRFPYQLPTRVYGAEMGMQGGTDASSCLRLMDRGRVEAIELICRRAEVEDWLQRYTVNVYRIDLRLGQPAPLGADLEVLTALYQRSSHRAAFDHRVIECGSDAVVGDATVEVSYLDQEGALVPVPPEVEAQSGTDPGPLVPIELRFTPPKLSPPMPFAQRYRVYFEDTDAQVIAYHVTYVTFAERATLDLLADLIPGALGSSWLERHQPRLTRLAARYVQAARLGDVLEVRTRVRSVEGDRALLEHRLVQQADPDTVTAEVIIEIGFSGFEGRTPAVPEPLQRAIEATPSAGGKR